MLIRCAIGVITDRGENVIPPTISILTEDEQDYLGRHVDYVRALHSGDNTVFCVFRPGSATRVQLELARVGSDEEFLLVAAGMVAALAAAMKASPRAKENCVVALMTSNPLADAAAEHVTFLKLDANIEAAHLERVAAGGIRLHVFRDLLPAPGDMQKGVSWPDPRDPTSELILHDANKGDAALYFGNAFSLSISSKAVETEKALVEQLYKQLGPAKAGRAVALVNELGGRADAVVAAVREQFEEFEPSVRALGGGGALPGAIRPNHLGSRKLSFTADGIELRVPVGRMSAVRTRADGDAFVTTIRTSVPLTPQVVEPDANDDAAGDP